MMKSSQIVFTFYFGLYFIAYAENTPNQIILPNGNELNGVLLQSFHSKKAYAEFRGLRYAKPPIGDLRLKVGNCTNTFPGTSWCGFKLSRKEFGLNVIRNNELFTKPSFLFDDIWQPFENDATKYGNICPQLDPWYDPTDIEDGSWDELKVKVNSEEDCLYANVATSHTKPENLLPVLVWIHGGNFQSESGEDYGVSKFMDHDIVVVTFNYRLGTLGFLNTENGMYNGNQGLKDQKLLLEWVKKCIHLFGGDPTKITLAGSNAGGVSVHLHMLSNYSRGLFHRAIIQSATAISPWVLMKDPKERMLKLAKHLQCGNDTDLGECIAQKDAISIVQKSPKITEWFLDPLVPFGPSIEMHGDMKDRFLSMDPYSILAGGNYWGRNLPVIIGVNSHEGLLHAMDIGHQGMLRMVFNMEWHGAAPISLHYKKTAVDLRSVSEAIRNYYFPITDDGKVNGSAMLVDKNFQFENLTNLYSDRHFFVPLHHSAKLMGQSNELYLYWFDHIPEHSIHELYGYTFANSFGPSHYDQLQYLFETPFFDEITQGEHIEFQKNLVEGFYTFINEGSPFFNNWKKVTAGMTSQMEPFIYNRIGGLLTDQVHIAEPFTKRVDFWKELFLMEYEKANFVNEFIEEQEARIEQKTEL